MERTLVGSFGFCPNFDLLPCGVEALGADLQVDAGFIDGLERVLERKVAVFQDLQPLVELLERLLVGQVLAHGSTSSTRAPRRPDPRRMRTLRSTPVAAAERITSPDAAPGRMLQPRAAPPTWAPRAPRPRSAFGTRRRRPGRPRCGRRYGRARSPPGASNRGSRAPRAHC